MLTEYTGANNKVRLKCLDCGYEWETIPRSVVKSKCGCPKCGVAKIKIANSKEKFLNKFNKDLYELVEFNDCMHVTVKCKTCGNLRTTNANNIYRYGCPVCGHEKTANSEKLSLDQFIIKARAKHGDKYNYSKVNYVNTHTEVIITCPEHGEFLQTPLKHLSGHGCPKCVGRDKTTNDFIKWAKKTHGNTYSYKNTKYVNSKTPVIITCLKHGDFEQLPYIHAEMGCGCPKCNRSHGEEFIEDFLIKNNYKYKTQFRLNNPYGDRNFVLDFVVAIDNKAYIIEFNGIQHYKPVHLFGGVETFEQQSLRDEHLRKYC